MRTSWSNLTSISVRGSVGLASPVDVECGSFIFKAMGKRSRPNCNKNGCKCKKQRKAVTLEKIYQLFTLRVFVLRDDFSERINRVIRGFAVLYCNMVVFQTACRMNEQMYKMYV
jgi:hypothetical protein